VQRSHARRDHSATGQSGAAPIVGVGDYVAAASAFE
jgi:hypothetical protein